MKRSLWFVVCKNDEWFPNEPTSRKWEAAETCRRADTSFPSCGPHQLVEFRRVVSKNRKGRKAS